MLPNNFKAITSITEFKEALMIWSGPKCQCSVCALSLESLYISTCTVYIVLLSVKQPIVADVICSCENPTLYGPLPTCFTYLHLF